MAETRTKTETPRTSTASPSRGPINIRERILGNGVPVPTLTTQDVADWFGPPDTNHRILRAYDLSIANRTTEFIRAHFLAVSKDGSKAYGTKRRGMVIMDAVGADCILEWMQKHKTAFPKMIYVEGRRAFAHAFTVYKQNSAPLMSAEPTKTEQETPRGDGQPQMRPLIISKGGLTHFDPVSPNVIETAELTAFLFGNGYSKADAILAAVLAVYGDSPALRGTLSETAD